jgi:excisionase family DNA binding protein
VSVLLDALAEAIEPLVLRIVREEISMLSTTLRPEWLTVEEVARRIGIRPSAVRERIRHGRLAANKWEGRWYIRAADLDAAIASSESSATVRPNFTHGPREVAASEGPATRRNPS